MESFESKFFNKYAPRFYPETFLVFTFIIIGQILFRPPDISLEVFTPKLFLLACIVVLFPAIAVFLALKDVHKPEPLHPEASRFVISVGLIIFSIAGFMSTAEAIDIIRQPTSTINPLLALFALLSAYVALVQSYMLYALVLDNSSPIDQNDVYVPDHPTLKIIIFEITVALILLLASLKLMSGFWTSLFFNLVFSSFINSLVRRKAITEQINQ